MRYLLVLCMSIATLFSYAHAPDEAFFDIFVSEQKLAIKAEFPWTIREAITTAYPDLLNAKTKAELEEGLFNYLQTKIRLLDLNQTPYTLQKIKAVPNYNGHSHGSLYLLIFDSYNGLYSIENKTMFEAYSKQINYHTIEFEGQNKIDFSTNISTPSYTFTNISTNTSYQLYLVIFFMITIVFFIVFYYRKNIKQTSSPNVS